MDKLTMEIAGKMGMNSELLMSSIKSEINATNAIYFIIGIIATITTLIVWGNIYELSSRRKMRQINFAVMAVGVLSLLIGIYRAVSYDHIYVAKLLELANKVGVM
ncbi:hypothetical protein D3C81_544250 [compost metagenome]